MEKLQFNKLIRDKVPPIMEQKGLQYSVRELSDEEFQHELLCKVREEAEEFVHAQDADAMRAELADMRDVLDAVQKLFGVSDEALAAEREKRMEKKGGFAKRLYLEWTQDDGYGENK